MCLALANATDDVTVWSPQDGTVSRVEDVSGILPCYLVSPQETVQRAALGKGGALTYRKNGAAPVSFTTEAVAKAAAAALQVTGYATATTTAATSILPPPRHPCCRRPPSIP